VFSGGVSILGSLAWQPMPLIFGDGNRLVTQKEIADFKDMTHWTHEFEGFFGEFMPSQITAMKFIEIYGNLGRQFFRQGHMDIYMGHEFGFEKQNMGIYHVEICWNTRWDWICNQQYGDGLRPMVAIFWGTTIHYQAFDPEPRLELRSYHQTCEVSWRRHGVSSDQI
jgi:hypothetical protein